MTKRKGTVKLGCYAGLDLSLAGTGGVLLDEDGAVVNVLAFSTSKREVAKAAGSAIDTIIMSPEVKQGDAKAMWARTAFVHHTIKDWLAMWAEPGCLVAIEDHAFGARGTSIYQLGHLHGLVRHGLQQRGHKWLLIAPTELKAAVAGRGGADKKAMMKVPTPGFSHKKYSASTRNNVVDAYWLARVMMAWSDAHCDDWDAIPESVTKVLRPHARRPGLAARELLP